MNGNNGRSLSPQKSAPSKTWTHYALWCGVRDALSALPAYFHSDTFIEGVSATDIFALNSALAATIENQVVDTLNRIRSVWDPADKYGACCFVRQPQSFPDVVLKDLANPDSPPLLGIELKGWYLLAKEGEPSMRFTQTEAACAEADLIMVVPWVLASVISGRPVIFAPYIEGARYAARYRNYYWEELRGAKAATGITVPSNAHPYPKANEATTDKPRVDGGGNFGRIARTGIMDDYLRRMMVQPVCGIQARYWLEFFKIFHQDATDATIAAALKRLRDQVDSLSSPSLRMEFQNVIAALEQLAVAESH